MATGPAFLEDGPKLPPPVFLEDGPKLPPPAFEVAPLPPDLTFAAGFEAEVGGGVGGGGFAFPLLSLGVLLG